MSETADVWVSMRLRQQVSEAAGVRSSRCLRPALTTFALPGSPAGDGETHNAGQNQ